MARRAPSVLKTLQMYAHAFPTSAKRNRLYPLIIPLHHNLLPVCARLRPLQRHPQSPHQPPTTSWPVASGTLLLRPPGEQLLAQVLRSPKLNQFRVCLLRFHGLRLLSSRPRALFDEAQRRLFSQCQCRPLSSVSLEASFRCGLHVSGCRDSGSFPAAPFQSVEVLSQTVGGETGIEALSPPCIVANLMLS